MLTRGYYRGVRYRSPRHLFIKEHGLASVRLPRETV